MMNEEQKIPRKLVRESKLQMTKIRMLMKQVLQPKTVRQQSQKSVCFVFQYL